MISLFSGFEELAVFVNLSPTLLDFELGITVSSTRMHAALSDTSAGRLLNPYAAR